MRRLGRGQRRRKAGLIRGHHRVGTAQNPPPTGCLHGVHQLIFCHPLLPRKLVLDGEKIVGVGAAQALQHGAAGQLPPVGRAFEVKPCQVIQQGLAHVALPAVENTADERITVVFMHKPHDGIHVKIGGAVGVAG